MTYDLTVQTQNIHNHRGSLIPTTASLVMSDLPACYLPGSCLSVKVINSDRSVLHLSFTASKAFTPFTMSQVLVVQSCPESHFLLKVYDPWFFSHHCDRQIKLPWSYDAEAGATTM
jgi:hypothetical protein